ncbi:MAG TPA: hypothetical protein VEU08_09690 [Vicinamibacterales bacterium]|nr:hypothetical protein [Vicinamibacterales bacterium]
MRRLAGAAMVATLIAWGRATPASPAPSGPSGMVDVLDYIIGSAAMWPRNGSSYQNQFLDVSARQVCWVKYGNPQRFECWRWDDQYVYHQVDHALDGDSPESYRFTDGRWMPRRLSVTGEWRLDVAANRIVWFDAACRVSPSKSGVFPYRQHVAFAPPRAVGDQLGVVNDVLLLEYQPYDPVTPGNDGPLEQFYFGKWIGWFEWDRQSAHVVFNRVGGPLIQPQRSTICAMP